MVLCTHRYYDPHAGRWINRDPVGYDGGMNLYGYCGGDAVNQRDITGYDGLNSCTDFSTGLGNFITFGTTRWVRKKMDTDSTVNYHSTSHTVGTIAGVVYSVVDIAAAAPAIVRGVVSGGRLLANGVRVVRAVKVGNIVGHLVEPMKIVRTIAKGEQIAKIIEEMKNLT